MSSQPSTLKQRKTAVKEADHQHLMSATSLTGRLASATQQAADDQQHKSAAAAASTATFTSKTIFVFGAMFMVLCTVRIVSALYNLLHDCDEQFNYWDPTHLLMYQLNPNTTIASQYQGMAL
jgi:Alg9-like mannosyltransferase family